MNHNNINLSICIPYKDRADKLKQLLDSISHLELGGKFDIEISLTDFSKDNFAFRLMKKYTFKFKYEYITSYLFTTPSARNRSAYNSSNNILFFCDVDMLLSQNIFLNIDKYYNQFGENFAYFPICHTETVSGNMDLMDDAYGNCIIGRRYFNIVGGYNESIKSKGPEDLMFYNAISQIKECNLIRSVADNFIHTYHPKIESKTSRKLMRKMVKRGLVACEKWMLPQYKAFNI